MRRILISFASAVLLAVCNAPDARAVLVVNEWAFGTGIFDYANSLYPSEFSSVVQNPFIATHSVMLGHSNAIASYEFGWGSNEAHFDISTSHHLAQLDGDTISSGRIYLTPSVDSLATFSGDWQYAWPSAAIGSTHIGVGVWDLATSEPISFETDSGGNLTVGAPFGTLDAAGSALIQAGGYYMLYYIARVSHIDPTPPGTFGEASGDFHFTITPIPEPAAGLLALAALSPRRRSRR